MEKKSIMTILLVLEFEGGFLAGIRHGKGREYDNFGKFKSRVKYLYGKKQYN